MVNYLLYMFRKTLEIHLHLRTRTDNTHRSIQHIENLGQLIDFCLPQKTSERQHPRVIPRRQTPRSHIGRVLQHRGKLKNRKHPVFIPYPLLQIPHPMLSRAPQDQHTGQYQPRHARQSNKCQQYVEDILQKTIHKFELK